MMPMISTLDEILEAKELIKSVEAELIKEGHKINSYQLGIMVEVPIAALFRRFNRRSRFCKYWIK